jgi:phage virion morphogenesis protein
MQIDFKIEGTLQRNLERAARKAGDLTYISKRMGSYMVKSTDKNFKKEGARGDVIFGSGEKWTGLKESTKRWRKRIGHPDSPILQVTGNLKNSLIYKPHKDKVIWGASEVAPYGKYHQFGTKYMTKRPFLKFLREDHAELVKVTREYIQRLFK